MDAAEFWTKHGFKKVELSATGSTAYAKRINEGQREVLITDGTPQTPRAPERTEQLHCFYLFRLDCGTDVIRTGSNSNSEETLKAVEEMEAWKIEAEQIFREDEFFHCEDCDTDVDAYKYETLEDTGHAECKIRRLTPAETIEAMKDCIENGCFEEARI